MSFFLQAEDGIRDLVRSRGLGDVYKRQAYDRLLATRLGADAVERLTRGEHGVLVGFVKGEILSLIHI